MKKLAFLAPVALLAVTVGLSGCASNKAGRTAADMGAVNTLCPMKPNCALGADSPTTEYKGKKVAFCCKGCVSEWSRIDDAERDERLAKAK